MVTSPTPAYFAVFVTPGPEWRRAASSLLTPPVLPIQSRALVSIVIRYQQTILRAKVRDGRSIILGSCPDLLDPAYAAWNTIGEASAADEQADVDSARLEHAQGAPGSATSSGVDLFAVSAARRVSA